MVGTFTQGRPMGSANPGLIDGTPLGFKEGAIDPPIQRFNDSTIQRFNDSTIQRFNDSTIQRFNDSTIQRFNDSPLAELNPEILKLKP